MSAAKTFYSQAGLKGAIKQWMQSKPYLWLPYWRSKQALRRLMLLRYHLYDLLGTWRDMSWPEGQRAPWSLSAELLFHYHKLEKGLVMPGVRRFFGADPVHRVLLLLRRWHAEGMSLHDPVYLGAIATLRSYLSRLDSSQLDTDGRVSSMVRAFLTNECGAVFDDPVGCTPYSRQEACDRENTLQNFENLVCERRSVRNFLPELVPIETLTRAVAWAQMSPSACNRQPCSVLFVSDLGQKSELLKLQNGNSGFGHLAPHIAVVMADASGFFDASERNQVYVDGGLFSMAFLFGLQAQGVSSCCLNWCTSPSIDRKAHALLKLPSRKRIVMLVAVGYAPVSVEVPRSPRRATSDIVGIL